MEKMRHHIQLNNSTIDNFSREIEQKSTSMKDLKSMKNFEQAIEELSYTVTETKEDLRTKLSIEDFSTAIEEQAGIVGILMAEN